MNGIPSISMGSVFSLRAAQGLIRTTDERLSTGLRINRGADDPAGLIASENLGARRAELTSRINAAERETMFLRAKDGALGALGSMASDLGSLVVRGASAGGMGAGEAGAIASQIGGIVNAIDSGARAARFNGISLLDGFDASSLGRTEIGTDPDTGEAVFASVRDLERLVTQNPEAAQLVARQASEDIAVARGEAGVRERALESERRASETEFMNTTRARSTIRDADYARETGERVRAGLLEEVNIRTILIGRQNAAKVMDLLLGNAMDVKG